jgi:spermidine synthase
MTPDPSPPDVAAPLVRTREGRRTLEFAPGDIQSEMLLARPAALVLDYARAMMAFVLFVPQPRHIVMVGLGGGSLAKFCYRHFPAARITVIELRADVIALREQFAIPPDDGRLRVVHADAARHLATLAGQADVLLVDGFDAAGLPPALADAVFYRDCRRALRPGGVLVVNVFSYDPRYRAILDALAVQFDGRLCWLDGVAGNNRIVHALNATHIRTPAVRRLEFLARWHGLGQEWLNRLLLRLVLLWIARRSLMGLPRRTTIASME